MSNHEPVTDKQTNFLRSLIGRIERAVPALPTEQAGQVTTAVGHLTAALALFESYSMSRGDASKVIDQAKALAEGIDTVAPDTTVRFRKLDSGAWGLYGPAAVLVPGAEVVVSKRDADPETKVVGDVVTTPDGKGNVCATVGSAVTKIVAGVHIVPGHGIYRSTGIHYVHKFVPCHWAYMGYTGHPKGTRLDSSTLADVRGARAVSWLLGNCCFCGRDLQNKDSIVAGYGPKCAKDRDLPHGSLPRPDHAAVLADLMYLVGLDVGVTEDYAIRRALDIDHRLDEAEADEAAKASA